MSISDRIVVMRDGVIQQQGKPQEVYDDPDNLFVAKFLGTPPINIFDGRVEGGKLYIGQDAVLQTDAPDGPVTVGIRPEGFEPGGDRFGCTVGRIEVMGRDTSVVCDHPAFTGENFRIIIDSDEIPAVNGRFGLKPAKVYLFDANGCRIRARLED